MDDDVKRGSRVLTVYVADEANAAAAEELFARVFHAVMDENKAAETPVADIVKNGNYDAFKIVVDNPVHSFLEMDPDSIWYSR